MSASTPRGHATTSSTHVLPRRWSTLPRCSPRLRSEALPKVADFHTAHREVEDALRSVVDELRDGHPGRADLWSTLIELHQVQRELVEQRLVQRLEALGRVREALGRLRELGPISEILRRAASELSDSCGLDRVLLSQVKEARLLPVHAHFRDDADGGRARRRGAARDPAGAGVPGRSRPS